ncbi:hypothetical protein GCM10027589_07800 [Actinocorallia lasiicapitis]
MVKLTTPPSTAWAWQAAAPPGALRYVFPGVGATVREARLTVEELFQGTGRADDAGLIVNELAANALLYTRSGRADGWFGVEITFGALARVAVADLGGAGSLIGAPMPSTSARADPPDEPPSLPGSDFSDSHLDGVPLGGRGLAIVADLAVVTGACGSDALGHLVWADLTLHDDPPES